MAEREPKLLSLQLKVHVLSTASLLLEVCAFTQYLLTAYSVLGIDAKKVRPAAGLAGDLLGQLPVRGKREGGRKQER